MGVVLIVTTRKIVHRVESDNWRRRTFCFPDWIHVLWLLLPIFSMTNPPVNWGYSRTVMGFFVSHSPRGEYGALNPQFDLPSVLTEWKVYLNNSADNFGLPYLIAPLITLLLIKKFDSATRKWLISVIVMFLLSNS